jgi:hypothetical protein
MTFRLLTTADQGKVDGPGAVAEVHCRVCGDCMLVVTGSAADWDGCANLCVCASLR